MTFYVVVEAHFVPIPFDFKKEFVSSKPAAKHFLQGEGELKSTGSRRHKHRKVAALQLSSSGPEAPDSAFATAIGSWKFAAAIGSEPSLLACYYRNSEFGTLREVADSLLSACRGTLRKRRRNVSGIRA
nr:hypothetical protein Itr_chr12CG09840 [Ipomoea trifida]